ncbi:heat shock transcription factor, X-linked-like [Scleropages formosus]|uniref:Heat shock transcription factor, X-linked-like n=1 Tax=Scleropages formosus TaxID=113540 RepID=A0A8C9R1G0_SCLFO|nr:heat shock transcription factor, X-linked-like [Scleropages formosus]
MTEVKSDKCCEVDTAYLLNPPQSRKRSVSERDFARSATHSSTSGNPELRALLDDSDPLVLTQKALRKTARVEVSRQQEHSSEGDSSSSRELLHLLTFPNKLWRIVNCDLFESLRWDDSGVYLVIDVEMFQKEFLDRKEQPRIFEANCMKSFVRQLNLYGFRKVNFAQERGLLFFYNHNFQRGGEHLLQYMMRRVGIKAAKKDGRGGKPGATVKTGGKRKGRMFCGETDQASQSHGGVKPEVSSTWRCPSPKSEDMGSPWMNQNQDEQSEGLSTEADPGNFSSHHLACVTDLSRSLLQVIFALTEATSHESQDPAVVSDGAQFQAMVTAWMSLCSTCFSLPLITALFLKRNTAHLASQANTDCFQNSEATGSATQP